MRTLGLNKSQRTLKRLADAFLDNHRGEMRPRTLACYTLALGQLQAWERIRTGPLPADLDDFMATQRDWTASTARIKRHRLARFLAYAAAEGYRQIEFEQKKPESELSLKRRSFSVSAAQPVDALDIQLIFRQIPAKQPRDQVLFPLLYTAFLRVSEATALRIQDVTFGPPGSFEITFKRGRHIHHRTVRDPTLTQRLMLLLEGRSKEELIFRAAKNGSAAPLTQQGLHKRWQTYALQAGVRCSLEDLRISGIQQPTTTDGGQMLPRSGNAGAEPT